MRKKDEVRSIGDLVSSQARFSLVWRGSSKITGFFFPLWPDDMFESQFSDGDGLVFTCITVKKEKKSTKKCEQKHGKGWNSKLLRTEHKKMSSLFIFLHRHELLCTEQALGREGWGCQGLAVVNRRSAQPGSCFLGTLESLQITPITFPFSLDGLLNR